jgi:hypothetical protein
MDGVDVVDTVVTTVATGAGGASAGRSQHRIRPARGLPGGRAVVGAMLVTAAAITVFMAYLEATAEPTTVYLVADRDIAPGTRFPDRASVLAAITSEAISLPPAVAERAIPVEEVADLVGGVVLAPLEHGDLLLRSALVTDDGGRDLQTLSFRIPAVDAVAGTLVAGERVDVLATYGAGEPAYTAYVVRGVPLLRIGAVDGGSVSVNGDLALTIAVGALEDVQALGHAITGASLLVTRSTATAEHTDPVPAPYRRSSRAGSSLPEPLPEPPTDPTTGKGS